MYDWSESSELWEQQGHGPLTVGELVARLSLVDANLPFQIELYDGTADRRPLVPVEFGLAGVGEQPTAVVLTCTGPPTRVD